MAVSTHPSIYDAAFLRSLFFEQRKESILARQAYFFCCVPWRPLLLMPCLGLVKFCCTLLLHRQLLRVRPGLHGAGVGCSQASDRGPWDLFVLDDAIFFISLTLCSGLCHRPCVASSRRSPDKCLVEFRGVCLGEPGLSRGCEAASRKAQRGDSLLVP